MNESKQVALQLLVLKAAEVITDPAEKAAKKQAMSLLDKGDRVAVTSPIDGKTEIGHILRTKPKAKAEITDRAAFEAWYRETYPDKLEVREYVSPANMQAAVDALKVHAPHLVSTDEDVVPEWGVSTVLTLSAGAGVPVGPGGEADVPGVSVETPDGTVTVNLDKKSGLAAVRDLFTAGLVAVDGTMRALPGSDS